MSPLGFFDVSNRYAGLDAKNDPLLKIDGIVPWEEFRSHLEAVWRKPANQRKSSAGRKPWDAAVMFKAIVLCALYNLSRRSAANPFSDIWVWRMRWSPLAVSGSLFGRITCIRSV